MKYIYIYIYCSFYPVFADSFRVSFIGCSGRKSTGRKGPSFFFSF